MSHMYMYTTTNTASRGGGDSWWPQTYSLADASLKYQIWHAQMIVLFPDCSHLQFWITCSM